MVKSKELVTEAEGLAENGKGQRVIGHLTDVFRRECPLFQILVVIKRSFLGTPHLAIPHPTNSSFLYAEAVSKRRYPFCTAAAIASSASTASVVL